MTDDRQRQITESSFFEQEYSFTEDINNESSTKSSCMPKRYIIMLLLFFGMMNVFILRVNLNVAVVEMTSNRTVVINNQTIEQKPEFDWNSKTKGILLSLFFYGYIIVMPFGGYLATKFGGVSTFGIGIFVTAIFTIISPINLYMGIYWFGFCRIIEGAAEALCYTSTADICSRWTKPEERSRLLSLTFSGVHIGITAAFPLCGFVAKSYGWPAIFYVTGESHEEYLKKHATDHSPDDRDRKFLTRIWRSGQNQKPYPWKNLLTSRPVIILLLSKVSYGWGYNLMVQCFPMYIKDATGAKIDQVGYLSAIPNFAGILTMPLSGYLLDTIINRNILTPTYAHKLMMCTSLLASASLLLAVSYLNSFNKIFILFILYKMTINFMFVTEHLVPLYLSPEYASGVQGITSLGYISANIISPTIFGFIVTDHSMAQWNKFFTISAFSSIVISLVFGLFSSSELQPWSGRSKNQEFQPIDQ
ncbi:vesicular glutamate transporter 3-like isoform X2 [Planococcus citri]|uniref:vesicular glutamate transporter 3-like isoform X2 n=1 Tax=Planococcus citri TaxID=170843 RepID=UPI0031F8F87C